MASPRPTPQRRGFAMDPLQSLSSHQREFTSKRRNEWDFAAVGRGKGFPFVMGFIPESHQVVRARIRTVNASDSTALPDVSPRFTETGGGQPKGIRGLASIGKADGDATAR